MTITISALARLEAPPGGLARRGTTFCSWTPCAHVEASMPGLTVERGRPPPRVRACSRGSRSELDW